MSFATAYVLSEVFASLFVPLLIVGARKRTNGPLVACAMAAMVCYAALWLLSGSQYGLLIFFGPQDSATALRFVLYSAANVTWQAAWVLAVYQAALGRQGRWIAALAATQVIANAVLLFSTNPCIWVELSNDLSVNGCVPPAPRTLHLISALWLIGPVVALTYALRDRLPRRGMAARGLTASPLVAPASSEAHSDADTDAELEVRTERL